MIVNLFSALGQLASRQDENYLTESLVYVVKLLLSRRPAAGLAVVNSVCGSPSNSLFTDPKQVLISTQVSTEEGRPDIEVQAADAQVYIEVKHDSPLGLGQLESYLTELQKMDEKQTRLVLLTRSRYSTVDTTLQPHEYYRVYWYEIFNWLAGIDEQDEVCYFFARSLMEFLEEKRMSMKKVGWEYISGVPAILDFSDMMEAAITSVMPGIKFKRTGGWSWRGFHLPGGYWFGFRFNRPLLVTYENNRGTRPTYKRDLDLEEIHFFSLSKDEQFESLAGFLRMASEGAHEAGLPSVG